ncbi:hypothetical protein [Streptomyces virginiae]|uniref:Uncharacterized protein n=1 Tax=Streptomyces virginiae TaxID=1961 RepID=A0ABZ1T900_STRVG|nr:hypothetical protein [Streptomyces virginiae]
MRKFRYRLRSPLGGLAADLSARTVPPGEAAAPSVVIHRGVRLLLPEAGLYQEDLAWLSFVVALRAEELGARCPEGVYLEIVSLDFPLTDYRPEVAALAMDGWLRAEFDLPDTGIACSYAGGADPYAFAWGGAEPPLRSPRLDACALGRMDESPERHIGELAVTGIDFLASILRTGRLHGIGIGSTLGEVDRAIRHRFVDVVDEEGESLRRDYGFVEFYFNRYDGWVMSGGSIELHRLASGQDMAKEWARTMGVEFPRHVAWADVREELGRVPGAPELKVGDQGGFLEYRAAASNVSVIVVDDEEEERGYHAGHGDVWSVSLWAPVRAK